MSAIRRWKDIFRAHSEIYSISFIRTNNLKLAYLPRCAKIFWILIQLALWPFMILLFSKTWQIMKSWQNYCTIAVLHVFVAMIYHKKERFSLDMSVNKIQFKKKTRSQRPESHIMIEIQKGTRYLKRTAKNIVF